MTTQVEYVPSFPTGATTTYTTSPIRLEVDVLSGPPAFSIELAVRLDRLKKRKCASCHKRRITYALRGYTGSVVISSSPVLCARCAGLVR